jgi:predicted MFS family arabinose efflux permease
LLAALMGLSYSTALDGVLSFLSYHRDSGGIVDIGLLSGLVTLSMIGRILGALGNVLVTRRLGYVDSLRLAVLTSALACLLLSLQGGAALLAVACMLFGFAYGHFTAAYAAVAMVLSDQRIAASMFAVFMMFLNIGVAIGQGVGGVLVDGMGFQVLAWIMAAVSLLPLFLLSHLHHARELQRTGQ